MSQQGQEMIHQNETHQPEPHVGPNVLRREVGEGRLLSVVERVDDSRSHVLNERVVEHEVKIPKRVVREEIIEKVIVVPEKVVVEEVIEEIQIVKERIVEVARPTVVQKVIEIPEIEYVEKIVEVRERVVKEKLIEKPIHVRQERVVEVPHIIYQDKIVEVPEVRYREVPVYRDVEVKEGEAPPPPQFEEVERKIPVPVEAEVLYEYKLPALKPKYMKVSYPVYLPRFIEVPVAAELLTTEVAKQAETYLTSVAALTTAVAGLGQVEDLAAKADQFMRSEIEPRMNDGKLNACVVQAWTANTLAIQTQEQQQAAQQAAEEAAQQAAHQAAAPLAAQVHAAQAAASQQGSQHASQHASVHQGSVHQGSVHQSVQGSAKVAAPSVHSHRSIPLGAVQA